MFSFLNHYIRVHPLMANNMLVKQILRGRWLLFAEFLYKKKVMGTKLGLCARFILRCLALPFLTLALKQDDSQFAVGFSYLCEKRQ